MNENSVILISLFWFFWIECCSWFYGCIIILLDFCSHKRIVSSFGDTNTKGVNGIYSSCGTYGKLRTDESPNDFGKNH
ncbi:hypothetical protein [Escherichia coli]|uniref:hypothetical protein n=1 Tax=Escherichia coli TaxID=562 RepID=UPI0002F16A58|nr:hypothetical protein [Escherichia coli]